MEKLYLIVCGALASVNGGYVDDNQAYIQNVYAQSDPYIHSEVKGGNPNYGSSFVPPVSYVESGSFSAQISHGSTGYSSTGHGSKSSGYVPVIKDGVPVDTPEVQKARAEHFQLYAKAAAAAAKSSASDGNYGGDDGGQRQYQPKYTQTYYPSASGQHNTGYSEHTPSSPGTSLAYIQSGPVGTPEIQPAKAIYYNTFVGSTSDSPNSHYRQRRSLEYSQFSHDLYGSQPQHIPVITKEGVPVETPEVQAAKAQHFLAHETAKSGHGEWKQGLETYGNDDSGWTNYETPQVNKVQYSVTHESTRGWKPYHGPQHVSLIDKNGVPIETPEVQAAKQQHFLAHYRAKLQSQEGWHEQNPGIYGYAHQYSGSLGSTVSHQRIQITSDGVPEETPEVKIAKARHLTAHAQEKAKHAQWAGQSEYEDDTGSRDISYSYH